MGTCPMDEALFHRLPQTSPITRIKLIHYNNLLPLMVLHIYIILVVNRRILLTIFGRLTTKMIYLCIFTPLVAMAKSQRMVG
jgi:hypothetical protein